MSDSRANLIYMANQIAREFDATGNVDAIVATADHIATFWDPRMKAALIDGDPGLSPTASAAFAVLGSVGAPPHQSRATAFGGDQAEGGSDAG